ncbi:MAG: hypothetical protein AB7H92_08245 [Microbacteriaceae bacterium]
MGASDSGTCSICDRVAAALSADEAIYEDDSWVMIASADRPGWTVLAARRHCDWAWGMDDVTQATFGLALAKVTAAIRDTVPAEKVYVLGFGEGTMHFHVLMMPGITEMNAAMRSAMSTFGTPLNDAAGAADARARMRKQLQP